VLVNGAPVTRHDHPLTPKDRVSIAKDAPQVAGVVIAYEDDALVVIDKPTGLLTVATGSEKTDTAFVRLRDLLAAKRAGRPFVVHRLDRDTSGLLLFAKSPEVRDSLQANWDAVTKTYLAVVEGSPDPAEGRVENYLTEGRDLRVRASHRPGGDAKRAASRYKVLATRSGYSLVEVTLETGRKHQIRVHLAGLGCPVAGDRVYGAKSDPAGRLALHAWKLAFAHPVTRKPLELESPLPEVLQRIVG
jgi:23S rRNA pseudouridine1911/1915/1917 synthase